MLILSSRSDFHPWTKLLPCAQVLTTMLGILCSVLGPDTHILLTLPRLQHLSRDFAFQLTFESGNLLLFKDLCTVGSHQFIVKAGRILLSRKIELYKVHLVLLRHCGNFTGQKQNKSWLWQVIIHHMLNLCKKACLEQEKQWIQWSSSSKVDTHVVWK